ncbi:MAG: squalene--hopene cyclase [Phycisphaeraceae bacterium]|nr:squalene--hopene cyclase [Phycisphaeraceae bacterium]
MQTASFAESLPSAGGGSVAGVLTAHGWGATVDPGRDSLRRRAAGALDLAVASLLAKQRTARPWGAAENDPGAATWSGHWCAELEGDSILSSEYLLMKWILGQENDAPGAGVKADRRTLERIANHLRLSQRSDGTWGQYPGSPADLSACVKGYFALKLMGDATDEPHMARARERILEMGGAEGINTFSMFYLACLGQVSWDACPAIPPQIALLPRWFPFHMDKVSAWTRTMILPLALCTALRPARALRPEQRIDELFVDLGAVRRLNKPWDRDEPVSWTNTFLVVDRLVKAADKAGLMPFKSRGIKAAERWIRERMDPGTTEGLGAIFPPMVYVQIAFRALGYGRDHPVIRTAEAELDAFMIEAPHADPRLDHVRLQPCFSPVWDTGIALYALTEAGLTAANSPQVAACCRWLLERQVRMNGDWARNLRSEHRGIRLGVDACAWAFEYRNDWYPDVDDTAMVAKALWRAGGEANREAARKACTWLVAMQNDDGGWAAFDRTKDRPWMEKVPFADHNAMQDPSCADITGRVLEALITCGVPRDSEVIQNAIRYDLGHQRPEGCWWGRWGVNYIYGTWQALGGLTFAGVPRDHPALVKAVEWLRSVQNDDGGFGESANTYLDDADSMRAPPGRGASTASQTAWAIMALLFVVEPTDRAVERAVAWLCDHQLACAKRPYEPALMADPGAIDPGSRDLAGDDHVADRAGGWNEHWFTGTGFPRVFYLRYHYYRHYFPVMALARYRRLLAR